MNRSFKGRSSMKEKRALKSITRYHKYKRRKYYEI
jgi:hypothetical protein